VEQKEGMLLEILISAQMQDNYNIPYESLLSLSTK